MEKLYNDIEKYNPFNEEESKDKESFLTFLENNDDAFSRENVMGHVTSSSWIVNKDRTKVLMIYHNIYNSWSWTGGHNDNDTNCLNVSIKEAMEETGLTNLKTISNDIFSVEILTVDGHYKRGKYVSSHLHYNVTYLLEADDNEALKIKEDENSGVKWIEVSKLKEMVREEWMYKHIYSKLVEKVKNL